MRRHIHEMNTVRRLISRIKGGRLRKATVAPMLTLAISDVPGDDPATIASGPTIPDPTTLADARAVLARRQGYEVLDLDAVTGEARDVAEARTALALQAKAAGRALAISGGDAVTLRNVKAAAGAAKNTRWRWHWRSTAPPRYRRSPPTRTALTVAKASQPMRPAPPSIRRRSPGYATSTPRISCTPTTPRASFRPREG